jgi:hypothetical protein
MKIIDPWILFVDLDKIIDNIFLHFYQIYHLKVD